jgi:hypothetical protein
MDVLRIAARVATSLTQPLSERYDYGTNQLVTQEETLPVTNIGEEQVHNVVSEQEKQSKIVHEKGKGYCVKSEKKNSDWSGGCYPTHGKAEERLKQVERAKHATDPLESIIFATNSFLVGPTPGGLKSLMHHIRRAEDALDLCSKEHISQEEVAQEEETAVAPPGWEPTVKKMKKHQEIDNPYALSWYMKNKGDKPHAKK